MPSAALKGVLMKGLVIACNQSHSPYPVIPAGASMVAEELFRRGVAVDFLDLCFVDDPVKVVTEFLASPPDFVAISFRNLDNLDLLNPVSYLPLLNSISCEVTAKNIPLYIGGSATAVCPDEILGLTSADTAFIGSAAAFARRLTEGNLPAGKVTDWSDESYVPRGIERFVDLDRYFEWEKMVPVRLKLGCPFKCSYCTYPSIEEFSAAIDKTKELELYLRHWFEKGICVDVVDAIFNAPEEWAIDMLEWMGERDLKGSMHLSALLPKVSDERIFKLMTDIGANTGMIGIDGGCDEMLASYNKPFRMSHVKDFLDKRSNHDVKFLWTFIVGGDVETEETMEKTMRFIETLPENDVAYITLGLRIFPRTMLYGELIESGYLAKGASVLDPTFYFAPNLDLAIVTERLEKWSEGLPNVVFSTFFETAEYKSAFGRMKALGVKSPGWRYIPAMKGLMKKMAERRGKSGNLV